MRGRLGCGLFQHGKGLCGAGAYGFRVDLRLVVDFEHAGWRLFERGDAFAHGDPVHTALTGPCVFIFFAGVVVQMYFFHALAQRLKEREIFTTPQAVSQYLQLHLATRPHEVFAVLFLDAQHRLIALEEMFRGTLTQTSVYPREVVVRALHHHAAAVVLAHNHPSGGVEPSRADEALTQTLKGALALVDVRVLDHVIVAAGQTLSMAEKGLI